MNSEVAARATFRERGLAELKEFLVIAVYLYICFTALLYLKAAILQAEGVPFAPFGLAAIKALLCAKFMSMGHALRLGERFKTRALIWPTLHKSFVFLALLFVLSLLEEVAVRLIHHRPLADAIYDVGGGTLHQLIAACVIMLLILIPFFAFRTLAEVVGEGNLVRVFLHPRHAAGNA
jgi:hypothetical protein